MLFRILLLLLAATTLLGCGGSSDKKTPTNGGAGSGQPNGDGVAPGSKTDKKIDTETIRKGVYELRDDLSFDDAVSTTIQGAHVYSLIFSNNRIVSKDSVDKNDSYCSASIRVSKSVDRNSLSLSKGSKLKLVTIQKLEDTKNKVSQISLGISYPNAFLRALLVDCNNVYSMSDFNAQIGNTIEMHPEGTQLVVSENEQEKPEPILFKSEINNYKFTTQSNFLIEKGEVTNFENYGSSFYAAEIAVHLQNQEFVKKSEIDEKSSYCKISYRFRVLVPPSGDNELTAEELQKFYFFDKSEVENRGLNTKKSANFRGPYGNAESTQFVIDMKYKNQLVGADSFQLETKAGQSLIATQSSILRLSCTNTFTVEEVNNHTKGILEMDFDI